MWNNRRSRLGRALVALLIVAVGMVRADEPKAPPVSHRGLNGDTVVLTPDEYKKLLEAAEQAKRLAAADKPEPPSVCRLSGRIETRGEREIAVLKAVYQFRTTVPRATVLLGLQKAKPVAATMDDGKLAVLVPIKDDDGFAVQVETAGEHKVTVDVESPVVTRTGKGGDRGVEIGLPGAAITTIERLDLPAGVNRVRLAGRNVTARQLVIGTESAPAALLGPTTKLEMTWDAPMAGRAEVQTVVESRYDVRVEDRSLATRARLTLKPQGGPIGRWEIMAPQQAEMTAEASAGADSSLRIDKPRDKSRPWVVRRDASGDDLTLDVALRTETTSGTSTPVPVFPVVGAFLQRGTISVGAPTHLRLAFKPGPELSRRDSADDASHEAVFAYYRLPESGSPLIIETQAARGDVETHVNQHFTLIERGWRWQGKFEVTPIRTEVTCIDLETPNELQDLKSTSAEFVEGITVLGGAGPGRKLVRIQLAESRRRPFTFALEGTYVIPSANSVALTVTRTMGTLDRGGLLTASAPAGLELRGSVRDWDGDRVGDWVRSLDPAPRGGAGLAATLERTPARIDLAWRDPRTDVAIAATADVQLGERQATVRHHWRFPASPTTSRQYVLRGSAQLAGRLRAVDGGIVTATNPGEWSVQITSSAGREATLTVAYSFPLPAGPVRTPTSVPLVWLDPCPRCETDVRVWTASTPSGVLVPALAEGPWTEVSPQIATDRPTLPILALHGSGSQLPLSLRLTEAAAGPGMGLVVERMWVQAVIDGDGQQAYRTRCLVRPQQTHFLDVELPASPTSVQFSAQLDGKRLTWTAADGGGGRFVRLRLDPAETGRGPIELELIYVMAPTRAGSTPWQVVLMPPRLRGPVFIGPVRWQIGAATDQLLLDLDQSADFEQHWTWHRGLLSPRPVWTTVQMKSWFASDVRRSADAEPLVDLDSALVGWQPAAEPIQVVMIPRGLALLSSSLLVLLLGWGISRVTPRFRWLAVLPMVVAVSWLIWARPQLATMLLFTAEPGLCVLAAVLIARWLLHRQYRRRVLFLPGFVRPTSVNTLHRRESAGQAASGAAVLSR